MRDCFFFEMFSKFFAYFFKFSSSIALPVKFFIPARNDFSSLDVVKVTLIFNSFWDNSFRKSLVHGTVHDAASSMFGGISGNAGLFGSAESIGRLIENFESWKNDSLNNNFKQRSTTGG